MDQIKVDDILQQIRSLSKEAGFDVAKTNTNETRSTNFSSVLSESINNINETQKNAGALAKSFEMGNKDVTLSEVMIEMQKARISFEALSQVRNKLISAYQEVMNMQV